MEIVEKARPECTTMREWLKITASQAKGKSFSIPVFGRKKG